MTTSCDISIEWRDDCVFVRLTRPEKLNAITVAMLDGLEECCDALEAGKGRALVLIGEGSRAFSAGTDLAESATLGAEASAAKVVRARNLFIRIYRASWTSVAAVNGLAYGAGFELALACTFRVAAPEAKFALPEIKLGVLPAYGGTQLLTVRVGEARALDLMLTGRSIQIKEAISWGLVDRVAGDASTLAEEAESLARSVLAHSQFAIDRIRRCVAAAGTSVGDAGLAVESEAFVEVMASEDAREGSVAFWQKRKPTFVHK